jgi:predicted nuclease of restriction endonuclease-like (RecB) superfamily
MKKPSEERKLNSLAKRKEGIELPIADVTQKLPDDYSQFLLDLKTHIKTERIKSVLSANAALVMLYWDIGQAILEKQNNAGWGAKIIDRMAYDLHEEFPDMRGFSTRNLKDMRKFAEC